jgi:hypothetical protein
MRELNQFYPFAFILLKGVAVIVDVATTVHEHDHGGFPETRSGRGSLPSFRISFDHSSLF